MIGTTHGDFGSISRLACNGPDLDHAFGDLGYFLLEESLDEMGLGSAEDDLHSAAGLLRFINGRSNALVGVMRFAGDLFSTGEDRLDIAQGHGRRAALVTLDYAGNQLAFQFVVFLEQRISLGLADLLDHHLLGRLRADPLGHLFRREGLAVVQSGNCPVFAIDRYRDILLFAVVLLGGRYQGRFDALEDDFLVDVLVAMDRVDNPQQFGRVHSISLSTKPETTPLGPLSVSLLSAEPRHCAASPGSHRR